MTDTGVRRRDALPWALTSAFVFAGLLLAARHEMWRDEMGAWLTVRDSASLGALFANLEYGGHPGLWYVCLKVLHLVFGSPWSMQVFSVAVAAGAVFVLARWSPFSATQKILLTAGYFVFYEYAVVARNYGLGMLLGVALCALYPVRRDRWVLVGVVLFLLAQTNALGLVVALAFLPVLIMEGRGAPRSVSWWTGVALAVGGIVVAAVTIAPPADSGFAVEWYFRLDADRWTQVGHAFRNAFSPLPPLGVASWGRNVMDEPTWRPMANLFALVVLASNAAAFLRRPHVLWFFLLGTVGIAALLYLKLDGSFRHHGYLFLMLVMAQWLHLDADAADAPVNTNPLDRPARIVFTTVLIVHLIGALSISFSDWRHPFSMARATAEYLVDEGLTAEPIVAYRDAAAAGVLGYAGIRSAYFLQGAREGSFVVWDSARAAVISPREVACGAIAHSERLGRPVLLLANRPLAPGRRDGSFTPLALFDGAIVPDENFSLTRVDAALGSGVAWCATRP